MRTRWLRVAVVLGALGGLAVAHSADRAGSKTQVGVRSSAAAKGVVVEAYDYAQEIRATLLEDAPGFEAGDVLTSVRGSGMTVYCGNRNAFGMGICYRDFDRDGSFDHAYIRNSSNRLVDDGQMKTPIAYRLSESGDEQRYKYELVYLGAAKGKANFGYREYVDNFRRPVYRQDLSFTLDPGETMIGFLAVELTIHSATKKQIEYTVHSGFDLDNHR